MKKIWTFAIFSLLFSAGIVSEAKADLITADNNNDLTAFIAQDPVFKDYRGVTLGMSAGEVRQKLGKPESQSDAEDTFEPANGESSRIVYNAEKKVRTISIMYTDDISKAPTVKAIVGSDVPANEDGRLFKKVDYPDHGFWISYARIAGDNPMVIIMIQAM